MNKKEDTIKYMDVLQKSIDNYDGWIEKYPDDEALKFARDSLKSFYYTKRKELDMIMKNGVINDEIFDKVIVDKIGGTDLTKISIVHTTVEFRDKKIVVGVNPEMITLSKEQIKELKTSLDAFEL